MLQQHNKQTDALITRTTQEYQNELAGHGGLEPYQSEPLVGVRRLQLAL